MNTPPSHPYPGPTPPEGVIPNPPYAINLQVIDPPTQPPNGIQPPILLLPESEAPRDLDSCYNVRTVMYIMVFLGVRFKALSLGRHKMTPYRTMSADKWNTWRVLNDEGEDKYLTLITLLRGIWLSCYHHQQQLVIGGICNIYALPRARTTVWRKVIPVLLSAFRVQIYQEDKTPQCSLWADFATSTRPHADEMDAAVAAALAVAI